MLACPLMYNFALHVEKECFATTKRYVESVAFEGFRLVAYEAAFLGVSPCRDNYGDPERDERTRPIEQSFFGVAKGGFHGLLYWGIAN